MTTPKRTSRNVKHRLPRPIPFTDERDRSCIRVPAKGGPDCIMLAAELAAIRPYQTNGKIRWNDDGNRDADGNLFRHYLKTTAREPWRRGPKNKARGMPVSRLIAMAMLRKHRSRFPRGYEVAFVDLSKRHDLRPENLKIRPRSENKHWVSAVLAFDKDFDVVTGFDVPDVTLVETSAA
jgi:hypothetical protein